MTYCEVIEHIMEEFEAQCCCSSFQSTWLDNAQIRLNLGLCSNTERKQEALEVTNC